jgi:hypothetical protein
VRGMQHAALHAAHIIRPDACLATNTARFRGRGGACASARAGG